MFKENTNRPLVSVIIPCYNHEAYVIEAIQSIIDQDYENIELIIIDDGSNDNSIAKIEEMAPICQKRFKRFEFRSRPNKGLCATLNEALDWCKGEFFSPLASDDVALPHKISYLTNKILDSDFAVVFGLVQKFNNWDKIDVRKLSHKSAYTHSFESLMLTTNLPSTPAAILRKSSVLKVGGYAEDVSLEDRYMWLSLTFNNEKLVTFPNIVTMYRDHDNNTTKNFRKMHMFRLQVLSKFKHSEVYEDSVKKVHVLLANELLYTSRLSSIKIVIHSKNFNTLGLKVLIHALLPRYMLQLRQELKKKF